MEGVAIGTRSKKAKFGKQVRHVSETGLVHHLPKAQGLYVGFVDVFQKLCSQVVIPGYVISFLRPKDSKEMQSQS